MKSPAPWGKYYYKTPNECLVVVESQKDGWLWSVFEKDSTPLRIGAHWPSKGRAIEDVKRALEETGHSPDLSQVGAQYTYHLQNGSVIEIRGANSKWHWVYRGQSGTERTKSAALAVAMRLVNKGC